MLKVHSIFKSISGEVSACGQGMITAFLRLDGCNLRCKYCDTKETQGIGTHHTEMTAAEVFVELHKLNTCNLIITGGEPLLQAEEVQDLCVQAYNHQHINSITIETNGTIKPPKTLLRYCSFVVDYKLDDFQSMMPLPDFASLLDCDFIKFVVDSSLQIDAAINVHKELLEMGCPATFMYSPVIDSVYDSLIVTLSQTIYKKLNEAGLEGGINLQLHKFLKLA